MNWYLIFSTSIIFLVVDIDSCPSSDRFDEMRMCFTDELLSLSTTASLKEEEVHIKMKIDTTDLPGNDGIGSYGVWYGPR